MFVRGLLAVVVVLVSVSQAFALTGRVVNADGAPVAGAEIAILPAGHGE
jgi:hypothetical protein